MLPNAISTDVLHASRPTAQGHANDATEGFTTARLEAFSDGVIAVIITIMVLELRTPRENGVAGLRAILPTLLEYLLSFAFTGIYWVNHHHLLHRTEQTDGRILYSNLVFLFFLSLLPFTTSWISNKHADPFSVGLYTAVLIAIGFSFLLLRLAVSRRLRRSGEFAEEDRATQQKHVVSLATYALALAAAQAYPVVALLLDGTVTLLWILPGLGIEGHARKRAQERFGR